MVWLGSIACFHGCLAFLHPHFPPRSPPSHPLDLSLRSQQQPSRWDCSIIPKLQLPAAAPSSGPAPLPGVCTAVARTVIFIPFRLSQVSCFTLSLTCFSSDSDNCPAVGIGPLLQFLHPRRAGPALLTLLFFPLVPLSYRVLHGSIYSFPLVRYSCRLSAGFLHAPLSLKVYSRYICGERHTPRPPTPLSSCSPIFFFISK